MSVIREYVKLFACFAKVGVLTFGGGYAMLPVLEREVIDKRQWASRSEMMDYYALSQCTPGVIAVNVATFVGSKRRGVGGGVIATLGVIFPSLAIMIAAAAVLQNFAHLELVRDAFAGVRAGVAALVLNTVIRLWREAMPDKAALAIFIVVFVAMALLELSPVLIVALAALAGLAIQSWRGRKKA